MIDNPKPVKVEIKGRGMVGMGPLLATIVVFAIEFLVVFIDLIQQSAQNELKDNNFVLSEKALTFHLTWGLVLSITLSFIEDSMRWLKNRKACNLFGALNALLCTIFLLACIYTWMWMYDAAGMTFICKYILQTASLRISPEELRQIIYADKTEYLCNLLISWVLPLQCIVAFVDCLLNIFCKQKNRLINIIVGLDNGQLCCKYVEESQVRK